MIKVLSQVFAGGELPTSQCMILAVERGIDRANEKSEVKPSVRKPLTRDMLMKGKHALIDLGSEGRMTWIGMAFLYYACAEPPKLGRTTTDWCLHKFCLTRGNLTFFQGATQLPGLNEVRPTE